MKIQHIVVPTDLSTEALRPCAPVEGIAKQLGARVSLLHVVQDLKVAPHGAPFAPAISMPDVAVEVDQAQKELEEQAKTIDPSIPLEVHVIAADKTAQAICDWAREHGADLIALSTHGRTGFRHLALGSVAEAVLRHSEVPVLAFPRQKK